VGRSEGRAGPMSKSYTTTFKSKAKRQLRKLPFSIKTEIEIHIDALADNPRPHGVVKLKARKPAEWRIRVGNYRVVYEIHDAVLLVIVIEIGDRKNVY